MTEPVESPPALFVDLDGTLIKTDLNHEGLAKLARGRFFTAAKALAICVRKGVAPAKAYLATRVAPDVASLPYREDLIDYLRTHKKAGVRIVLATASDQRWASAVAAEVGLFDDVLASDGVTNLKSHRKLKAIKEYCERHGIPAFNYVGDWSSDICLWEASLTPHAISPSGRLRRKAAQALVEARIFGEKAHPVTEMIRAMRPTHWVANVLVFAPLLFGLSPGGFAPLAAACAAFFAFSFAGSGVHVCHGLMAIDEDRRGSRRRNRPFASGDLPIRYGPPLALGLAVVGVGIALTLLPATFLLPLLGLMLLLALYLTWLRSIPLVHLATGAALLAIRLLGGAVAIRMIV